MTVDLKTSWCARWAFERSLGTMLRVSGKPGEPTRMPPQIAPYHLGIDWLMWFAAMSSPSDYPWFPGRPLASRSS